VQSLIDRSPIDYMDADEFPSAQPGRKNFLLPAQLQAIQSFVKPEMFRHVFTFLVNTGCRWADAVGDGPNKRGLEWPNVYFGDCLARIRRDKRGKEKIVPLNQTVLSMLDSLPRKEGSDRVFWFSPDGDYLSEGWRRATRAAGLPGITLHDLKHTFYSLMRRQGVEVDVIARVAGNDDLDMAMRYENFASLAKDAVNKLDSLWVEPEKLHGVTVQSGNETVN